MRHKKHTVPRLTFPGYCETQRKAAHVSSQALLQPPYTLSEPKPKSSGISSSASELFLPSLRFPSRLSVLASPKGYGESN
jgi:hypothetical protein